MHHIVPQHSVTTVLLLAEYLQDCLLFAHSHFTSRICKVRPGFLHLVSRARRRRRKVRLPRETTPMPWYSITSLLSSPYHAFLWKCCGCCTSITCYHCKACWRGTVALWYYVLAPIFMLPTWPDSEWQRTIAFEYLVPSLVEMSCGAGGEAVMQGAVSLLLCD